MARIISATLVHVYEEEGQYRLKKKNRGNLWPHFDFTHMMNRVDKNKTANSDS